MLHSRTLIMLNEFDFLLLSLYSVFTVFDVLWRLVLLTMNKDIKLAFINLNGMFHNNYMRTFLASSLCFY